MNVFKLVPIKIDNYQPKKKSSLRQTRTADLYIISVAL